MARNGVALAIATLIIQVVIYSAIAEFQNNISEQPWTPSYHIAHNFFQCIKECKMLYALKPIKKEPFALRNAFLILKKEEGSSIMLNSYSRS
ncbi:uncharacterized protein DS421_11g322740 [Arachis hypogaea]|nr:uncharacterized protein DS421_11g322740 [Arachis hypogaea]